MKKRGTSFGYVLMCVIIAIILLVIGFFIGKSVEEKKINDFNNQGSNSIIQPNIQDTDQEQNQQKNTESQTEVETVSELTTCLEKITIDKIPTSLKLFKSGNQVTYAGKPGKYLGTLYWDLNNNKLDLPSLGYRAIYISPTNYYNSFGQVVKISIIISKINEKQHYDLIINDLNDLKDKGNAKEEDLKGSKIFLIDTSNKTQTSNKWYAIAGKQQYLQFSFDGINIEEGRPLLDQFVSIIC
ncbi:hypothetical protein HYW75_05645 [Candidatus Pacearchaeota archaeon]|nr:hypothetical protein [Candidatus Pacearchaeota archaeon]